MSLSILNAVAAAVAPVSAPKTVAAPVAAAVPAAKSDTVSISPAAQKASGGDSDGHCH